jgi:hypothetical protein
MLNGVIMRYATDSTKRFFYGMEVRVPLAGDIFFDRQNEKQWRNLYYIIVSKLRFANDPELLVDSSKCADLILLLYFPRLPFRAVLISERSKIIVWDFDDSLASHDCNFLGMITTIFTTYIIK